MHGRIYQIETHPLVPDEALSISWDLDDIKPEIADYVDDDPNPTNSISRLKENLANRCGDTIIILDDGFILREGFREAYFRHAHERFLNELRGLEKYSLSDFATGQIWEGVFNLKDAYDNAFGDYVWSGDNSLETRDEFMRRAKPGIRYYFGGTLDYHW